MLGRLSDSLGPVNVRARMACLGARRLTRGCSGLALRISAHRSPLTRSPVGGAISASIECGRRNEVAPNLR